MAYHVAAESTFTDFNGGTDNKFSSIKKRMNGGAGFRLLQSHTIPSPLRQTQRREKESLSKDTACLHLHRTRAEAHEKTDIAQL